MIKRVILPLLEEHLLVQEVMTIITGPRQAGKTYLMRVLENKLKEKGEKTLYLNLDFDEQFPLFASQGKLIDYIKLQVGEGKAYIFIDEIQRKENAELFLKGLYDMRLPYKFVLSGSGSLELKSKIPESMAGRKRFFTLNPLSFAEFVNAKTNYRYEGKLADFFRIEQRQTQSLFDEYMMYGGYPRVVLADTIDKKRAEMEDIYTSYIERDIKNFLDVAKPEAYTNLVKILAAQIGNLVNTTELSSTIGIADKTAQHYLWYLEKTFVLTKVTPFYRNVRSEITKAPIYYFVDSGLRNFMLGLFGLPSIPSSLTGHLFENIIFNMLREDITASPTEIHFWRTRDQAEVDFVLETGLNIVPVEAKHTRLQQPEVTRSFRNFLLKYKPGKGYIVHLGEKFETEVAGSVIYTIPFFDTRTIAKV